MSPGKGARGLRRSEWAVPKRGLRTDAGRAAAAAKRVKKPARRRARRSLPTVLLRWCMVGALVFVTFLYYKPLTTFLDTREQLAVRRAEVAELREERQRLEDRLARSATTDVLAREARRIGYVRPGERLFIVKGIPEWRRERRATIGRDG